MNQNDSPLVYSCAFWSLFYSFGKSVLTMYFFVSEHWKDGLPETVTDDKLQKAQEYTRGESFWFILLNES